MPNSPPPPADLETKNIIDKFAPFVAKNGPSFEELTRQKQFGNEKFSFLFGKENSDYYRYRVMRELEALGAATMSSTSESNYDIQIAALRKQISDSESNLQAQKQVLQLQKQARMESLLTERENQRISSLVNQLGLDITPFEKLIDHMVVSGSKDTIANSKKWIFDNCQTDQLREVILTYLLHRVRFNSNSELFRLHVLYLINDWAHYCQRKKLDNVRQMLSRYVPRLYAYATSLTTIDSKYSEKLDKLIGVWEGYKYFDDNCYKQLRNPASIMAAEQAQLFADQQALSASIDRELSETYAGYENQHKEYEAHVLMQIATIETTRQREKEIQQQLEIQKQEAEEEAQRQAAAGRQRRSRFDQEDGGPPMAYASNDSSRIPSLFSTTIEPPLHIKHGFPPPPSVMGGGLSLLPPASALPSASTIMRPNIPQLSTQIPTPDDLVPKVPYYELPAGMMVPLIPEEGCTFKPLKESELKLPVLGLPSEDLLAQLQRFYNMHSTPEHPRDSDGWEVNSLIDHYTKKVAHRIRLEEQLKKDGKTLEDIIEPKYVPLSKSSNERERTTSKDDNKRSRSTSSSRSSGSSSSSSSSSSDSSRSGRSRSRSRSRSVSRSRSNTPPARRRRVERSVSPSDVMRPSFGGTSSGGGGGFIPSTSDPLPTFKVPSTPLNREQNKGAQLMAKMGWKGSGLGVNEQGIEEPIQAGEVRDREDQFRGIGSKSDIFEEYRKQMSRQTFQRFRPRGGME